MGAVHTLISVPSEATKWSTSVKESPAESVTLLAVGLLLHQTPTMTTRRSPAVTLAPGATEMLVPEPAWLPACWTKAGGGSVPGVTEVDGEDASPVPTPL